MWTSLKYMKIWGCLAYALIPTHQSNKLEPKTKRCFIVEYSSNSKGYRLYDPIDEEITEYRHVKFLEDRFDCDEYLGEK